MDRSLSEITLSSSQDFRYLGRTAETGRCVHWGGIADSFLAALRGYSLLTLCVVTHGQLAAWEDFGGQHWGDAAEPNGLFGSVECLQDVLHLFGDGAVLALSGPSTQVFSHSKAT